MLNHIVVVDVIVTRSTQGVMMLTTRACPRLSFQGLQKKFDLQSHKHNPSNIS